ncbi:MAG: radical SAM family heme chaperone HemW [Mariprofundus sp.]|nr:radical SAM family heme chaperone HemW [Mariprofundus sp.]
MSSPSPLQLYVHIPFCVHKCHYCDFNSHERSQPAWDDYQHALINELKHWADSPMFSGRKLSTIFIGGGTPSLAPPKLIKAILDAASTYCGIENDAEISMEANPGTVDADHFKAYRQAGVNRLSIGIQSLDATELRWLERIHSSEEAVQAYRIARQAGFDNINLDLMYGLPGQSLNAWLPSLQKAIALKPEHLSCYQLTVEPHTKLAATHALNPYALPNDDDALAMFFETRKQLSEAGFNAYEISNFSQTGRQCQHNDGYWLYHDYIGIGAGAAGKWDIKNEENTAFGVIRYSNIRTPEHYIKTALQDGKAINSSETLEPKQAAAEAFWLGLRRSNGINRSAFKHRFGIDAWQAFSAELKPWKHDGQLIIDPHSIRLSHKGLAMADAIAASVL